MVGASHAILFGSPVGSCSVGICRKAPVRSTAWMPSAAAAMPTEASSTLGSTHSAAAPVRSSATMRAAVDRSMK